MQYTMNKLQKIIIGFAVLMVLFGAVTKMVDTIRKQRAEIGRLERNVEAMNDAQIEYKTKLGDAAVKRKALEMSHKELKKTNADLYKEVDVCDAETGIFTVSVGRGKTLEEAISFAQRYKIGRAHV